MPPSQDLPPPAPDSASPPPMQQPPVQQPPMQRPPSEQRDVISYQSHVGLGPIFTRPSLTIVGLLGIGAFIAAGYISRYRDLMPTSWRAATIYGIAVLVILCLPALRNATMRFIDRVNDPNRISRVGLAVFVFLAIAMYLYVNGLLHERDMTPRFHDENSYLIQARMLARGRLWMPPFPDRIGDFFESFHILVKPVYASIYFPGTAMLYVPGMWLGAPPWATAILVNAAAGTLLFLVASRLLNGSAYGLLAAIMFVATPRVRWSSAASFSHPAAMLAGLLLIWTWLRWREDKRFAWAAALGAAIGWSGIVRPFDLLAYGVPLGIVFLFEIRKLRIVEIAGTFLVIALAAAPFLSLQLILNRGTTGDAFTTPYRSYIDQFQPGSQLGFPSPPGPDVRPQTSLQQKLDLYDGFALPQLKLHRIDNIMGFTMEKRVPYLAQNVVPSMLLIALLPLGIIASFRDPARLAIVIVPLLFMALYVFNPYFVQHYPQVVAPAVILTLLFALSRIDDVLTRISPALTAVPLVIALAITLPGMPEFCLNFDKPEPDAMPSLQMVNEHLAERAGRASVVLFRYEYHHNFHVEPVYNFDVAWPLDASVIRAHDLGPQRDREIVQYFAAREPKRMMYLFIREPTPTLIKLGRAGDWREWYETSPLVIRPTTAPDLGDR